MAASCNYRKFICVRSWTRAPPLCVGWQKDNASDACIMFRRIKWCRHNFVSFYRQMQGFFHLSQVRFLYLFVPKISFSVRMCNSHCLHLFSFSPQCVLSFRWLSRVGLLVHSCLFNLFQRLAWGKPNIGHQVFSSGI